MPKSLRFILLLTGCVLQVAISVAQKKDYTSFTVADGLPSNNVYRVLEDHEGFLWITTDAGIVRFDGKNFQLYTTQNGVPDNEVLYIEKEKDHRIWIGSYKQIPAYFDPVKNRFITPLDQEKQLWFENTLQMIMKPLKNGGMFYGNYNHLIFKNGKLDSYGNNTGKWKGSIIEEFDDNSSLFWGFFEEKNSPNKNYGIFYYKGDQAVDSVMIVKGKPEIVKQGYSYKGKVYLWLTNTDECVILSDIKANPIRFKRDTIHLPEPALNYSFTEKNIYFPTYSGRIYIYDQENLQLKDIVHGDYLVNGYGEDSKGNQYVSTVDKGLIIYRNYRLKKVNIPKSFEHTNFMSIAQRKDGTLFAGNYHGEIAELKDGQFSVHSTTNIATAKIRKILFYGKDIFTFSEQGIYRNYKQRITISKSRNISFAKTAISYNDSIIIIGTHFGLAELNTHTIKTRELILNGGPEKIRITALVKTKEPFFYFGSIDGLYRYNYNNGECISLEFKDHKLKNRITALGYTKDGLLWAATSVNQLVVLKNDKIISIIYLETELNAIRSIIEGKPGDVWISGSNGIRTIQYSNSGNNFAYNIRKLTIKDGLQSNDVQELLYSNGTIYAATGSGVSIIPENYRFGEVDIPTHLVNMRIDQQDTIIANTYQLKYGQQDVQMQFSGIDLDGRFNYFQYQMDNHKNWTNLYENSLNMQLRTGNHILKVRSVDVNGHFSNKILVIYLNVAVPFWQNLWFWVIFGILLQILIIYIINRYQKRRRETKLSKKIARVQTAALEQQAFTSLMNPHFMFNALNSIQHYINMQDRKNANRYLSDFASLIRKNFDAAFLSFIELEEEIENIRIYLNLERMRFIDRLNYSITIDDELDTEDWMVPVMVLQPLLENAILHGIMPSTIPGEIDIKCTITNNDLQIVITDNGIGLQNSRTLKKENSHKSSGILLISKRIKALESFGTRPVSMAMEPAFESITNPGNKVVLIIPYTLYNAWKNSNSGL